MIKAWKCTGVNGESVTLSKPDSEFLKVASMYKCESGVFLSADDLQKIFGAGYISAIKHYVPGVLRWQDNWESLRDKYYADYIKSLGIEGLESKL